MLYIPYAKLRKNLRFFLKTIPLFALFSQKLQVRTILPYQRHAIRQNHLDFAQWNYNVSKIIMSVIYD